jgi:pyridine nucleotide-disulfide oxidoreductase domain-containing protein 1
MHLNQEVVTVYDNSSSQWLSVASSSTIEVPSLPKPTGDHPVYVYTSTGEIIGGDLIVSATGVRPVTSFISSETRIAMMSDGSLLVDDYMRTSIADIYAAGDCCHYHPILPENDISDPKTSLWFQMRLWSQVSEQ